MGRLRSGLAGCESWSLDHRHLPRSGAFCLGLEQTAVGRPGTEEQVVVLRIALLSCVPRSPAVVAHQPRPLRRSRPRPQWRAPRETQRAPRRPGGAAVVDERRWPRRRRDRVRVPPRAVQAGLGRRVGDAAARRTPEAGQARGQLRARHPGAVRQGAARALATANTRDIRKRGGTIAVDIAQPGQDRLAMTLFLRREDALWLLVDLSDSDAF